MSSREHSEEGEDEIRALSSKRGRDDYEDEFAAGAGALQASLRSSAGAKLDALARLVALVDPADDGYVAQRALVGGTDAAAFLVELLADGSDAVGAAAARAVRALARHAAPAAARLDGAGPLPGLETRPTAVALNPVAEELVGAGAVAALVPWAVGGGPRAEAAADALRALCSWHRAGQEAHAEGLVQLLRGGGLAPEAALAALERLGEVLDGLEPGGGGGELAGLHADARALALAALRGAPASGAAAAAALELLSTLCEKDGAAAAELRAAGGLAAAARRAAAAAEPVGTRDAAARLLWLLVRDDPAAALGPGAPPLEVEPPRLAAALRQLCAAAEEEEAARERDDGGGGGGGGACGEYDDICYAEEAARVLEALAKAYPDSVQPPANGTPTKQQCCVM